MREQSIARPKRYAKISTQKRKKLIDLALEKGYCISRAAKKLNLKLSTAKLIVKRFKETGTFFQKTQKKLPIEEAKPFKFDQICYQQGILESKPQTPTHPLFPSFQPACFYDQMPLFYMYVFYERSNDEATL